MKTVAVISGKGGTGKTSFAAAIAPIQDRAVFADCDVDAADLALILEPLRETVESRPFHAGWMPQVDPGWCCGCGACARACRFDAIAMRADEENPVWVLPAIDPLACEGCGACADVCKSRAISLVPREVGDLFTARNRFGEMVYARLGVGEDSSGKLVTEVRRLAESRARATGASVVVIDGPPGIGCPVLAAMGGADAAVVVTEPGVSGVHDLERVLELCAKLKVPAFAAINKWDLHPDGADRIETLARERGARVLCRLPFDRTFHDAIVEARPVTEWSPSSPVAMTIREAWSDLLGWL